MSEQGKQRNQERSDDGIRSVGKLDKDIYKVITNDIVSENVIITDKQAEHIKDGHLKDYEWVMKNLNEVIRSPDYIMNDNHANTGLVVKAIEDDKGIMQAALRIKTSKDNPEYENSIISAWRISEKRLESYLRTKEVLYKAKKQ